MQSNDRKLAWSGIVVAAVMAAEAAWYLVVGPCKGEACHEPLWAKPEFWTAVATLILAIMTLGLWLQTKRLAEGADDQSKKMVGMIAATEKAANAAKASAEAAERALVISDRPWIGIDATIAGPLKFEEDDVVADFDVTITNIGKSPAPFVTLYVKLHTDSFSAQMYAQKTAREHFGPALLGYGNILFPNSARKSSHTVRIPRAEFIAEIRRVNDTVQASDDKDMDKTPYTHSFPGVSAMVFYSLPNDPVKRPKHTTLILDIKLKRPEIVEEGEPFEVGFDGSVEAFAADAVLLE